MNKLYELLETEPEHLKDQFDKAFKKVFGIPAEVQEYNGGVVFNSYDEMFSLDWEGTLLWYLNEEWVQVSDLTQARELWKTKKS